MDLPSLISPFSFSVQLATAAARPRSAQRERYAGIPLAKQVGMICYSFTNLVFSKLIKFNKMKARIFSN